jgi:hypothetical protein
VSMCFAHSPSRRTLRALWCDLRHRAIGLASFINASLLCGCQGRELRFPLWGKASPFYSGTWSLQSNM